MTLVHSTSLVKFYTTLPDLVLIIDSSRISQRTDINTNYEVELGFELKPSCLIPQAGPSAGLCMDETD
jgi:hypothetical protein